MYNSEQDTLDHIEMVTRFLSVVCRELSERAACHDSSKLGSVEKPVFDVYAPKLRECTYGSDEYKSFLVELRPALDHHYANNRHHPEHFVRYECNGCFKVFSEKPDCCDVCGYSQFTERPRVFKMSLIDIIEMFCDWKAATLRHRDGDFKRSILLNQKRFEISDELTSIFLNTVELFDGAEKGWL